MWGGGYVWRGRGVKLVGVHGCVWGDCALGGLHGGYIGGTGLRVCVCVGGGGLRVAGGLHGMYVGGTWEGVVR